jgi:hypothetical protein
MTDARFEDGAESPVRLMARDADDLTVISALVQDAVLTGADLAWHPRRRRFSLLVNRFRWEQPGDAERVRSVLDFADVRQVRQQGLDRRDADTVLSLLALRYEPDAASEPGEPAGPGRITLIFAGDGAIALDVECIEVQLADVTRPYRAPARRAPTHKE